MVTFRVLKLSALGVVGFGSLKAIHTGLVGSSLLEYAKGYHIYKDIWEASTGEQLLCQCDRADQFAVVAGKVLL